MYANDKKNSIFPSFEKVTIQILGQRKTVFITDLSAGKKLSKLCLLIQKVWIKLYVHLIYEIFPHWC